VALLARLKGRFAMILVEHDMTGGVRAGGSHLGHDLMAILASGTPDAVRNDPAVATAYLGGRDGMTVTRAPDQPPC